MLILGLLLIVLGAAAILAAFGTASGTVELLGTDLSALTVFLVGVGAGVAILLGFTVAKFGTKRSLQHRRESKKLSELSEKLDRVEAERHDDKPGHTPDRDPS